MGDGDAGWWGGAEPSLASWNLTMPTPTAKSRSRGSSAIRNRRSPTVTLYKQPIAPGDLCKVYQTNTSSTIALPRLLQLTSALMMGGGPGVKPEHMLVILPFPEPTAILNRIRKNHPHIRTTFRNLTFHETPWKGVQEIPRGTTNP